MMAITQSTVACVPRTQHLTTVNAFESVVRAELTITDDTGNTVRIAGRIPTVVAFTGMHLTMILLISRTYL